MSLLRLIARLDIKGANVVKGVQMEGLRVVGKPEEMAKRFQENPDDTLDDFCPYEEGYKVGKLKFKGDEPPISI